MTSVILSLTASIGTYLLMTSSRRGSVRKQVDSPPGAQRSWATQLRHGPERWLRRAGLDGVTPLQFACTILGVGVVALVIASMLIGLGFPAVIIAVAVASAPVGVWRRRREAARRAARESWPRLVEELRVLTGAVGRPIPQALLEVGLRGPVELRSAFIAAQREWALTMDFERMVGVLKERLDDPTADATCETLLVAYEVGGEIDRRLQALAEDRRIDVRDRKEAMAKQAGARFARWFVIIVPAGMGLAGLGIGDGRAAFDSASAQLLVASAIVLIVACWVWAGRIMVLPDEERVFDR